MLVLAWLSRPSLVKLADRAPSSERESKSRSNSSWEYVRARLRASSSYLSQQNCTICNRLYSLYHGWRRACGEVYIELPSGSSTSCRSKWESAREILQVAFHVHQVYAPVPRHRISRTAYSRQDGIARNGTRTREKLICFLLDTMRVSTLSVLLDCHCLSCRRSQQT